MKLGRSLIPRRVQLQWAALLVIAVVLPTVSLLWFMSRVVANERLVIRQKLGELYQDQLAVAATQTEAALAARLARLNALKPTPNPYALFRRLVLEEHFQGVIVWNAGGNLVYPQRAAVQASDELFPNPLAEARQREFAQSQYAEAAALYERFATQADPRVAITALIGQSRCLAKLGRMDEALAASQKAADFQPPGNASPMLRLTVSHARLLLLAQLNQTGGRSASPELFTRTIAALNRDLFNAAEGQASLPANQNLFVARKILEALATATNRLPGLPAAELETLVAAEGLSLAAAETARPDGALDTFFQMDVGGQPVHCLRHKTTSATWLVIIPETELAGLLTAYPAAFAQPDSAYRLVNAAGDLVAGTPTPPDRPFATAALPGAFPGWKVELYFTRGNVFEAAAQRQIAVYIWTGVLVILLILVAGGFAMRFVGQQIRLNKMKNDFIATVSHELKTPLASMRVLVDTLLEGHIRDEAQAREYLRLTAKENERLSRMIDNFLTFSRMERNKNTFVMNAVNPAMVVHDAVEAVQTKFAAQHCQLTLQLADHLPEIQADHDALITVLVNLLDNACKYTTADKQITLAVFAEPGWVGFAVSDNGIGLARKHCRKIFDSFYQVDSSLARKVEGCGLGLSIVKFIVDAHKGRVHVESKPGQGSRFIVRLPVGRKHGDG